MATAEVPPLTLLGEAFLADPHAVLAAHRRSSAAVYDDVWHAWVALRYREAAEILRDPSYRKDPKSALDGPYTQTLLATERTMLFMDDPDHRRLRGLVAQAFSKRSAEALRPGIQAVAAELVDGIAALGVDGGAIDLMRELAVPLPIMVIAQILGIDADRHDDFKRWSEDAILGFDPFLPEDIAARVAQSNADMRNHVASVVDARRAHPREDLVSALVAAQGENGDRLSDDELVSSVILLLAAGNVTTTDLIGNGVFALLGHAEQLRALQANPSLIVNAVEEMLRFDPPVLLTDRIATTARSVGGCPVRAGEWVWPMLAAANRDADVNPDPDEFEITRADVHHLSFGGGTHLCLGAALARLEAQTAIATLVERFPRLRLASQQPVAHKFAPGFRGLTELLVRVD